MGANFSFQNFLNSNRNNNRHNNHHQNNRKGSNVRTPNSRSAVSPLPNEDEHETKHNANNTKEQADSLQMVLPKIYMGSAVAAKNLPLLKSYGITHILAIGWNLGCYHPEEFKYLLINQVEDRPGFVILAKFQECFDFMDDCFNESDKNRIFVHCHKGLSRSATIIIAYEMWKHHKTFDQVLQAIQEHRSFIMPNIGFQAQLKEFEQQNYSLNLDDDYKDFNVISQIQSILPSIRDEICAYYHYYKIDDVNKINDKDLFAKTMYIHQVHKLREKKRLNEQDIQILNECIDTLRKIQVEFIKDEQSIHRFDIMFTSKSDEV